MIEETFFTFEKISICCDEATLLAKMDKNLADTTRGIISIAYLPPPPKKYNSCDIM